jgi:hypothetical protein
MTDKDFIKLCKEEVKNYTNKRLDKTGRFFYALIGE